MPEKSFPGDIKQITLLECLASRVKSNLNHSKGLEKERF